MREDEEDINHQFNVWHFKWKKHCLWRRKKSIRLKLRNAAKKKTCEELKPWIKLICNHFWWSHATCEEEEIVLKEKLASIFFHIQNKCFRGWFKKNPKVYGIINCLNKNLITHFVWYLKKEIRCDIETLSIDRVLNTEHFYGKIMQKMCTKS